MTESREDWCTTWFSFQFKENNSWE